jgi:hypothetical protein
MHMMSQLIQIYLFRPYYRSQLDISPTPAERCGQAAGTVAELLRVSEQPVFTFDSILDRSSCMTRSTVCGTELPRSVGRRVLYTSVRETETDLCTVPIVFGAATVYLLRLVSNEVEPRDLNNLEESVSGTISTRSGPLGTMLTGKIRFMGELGKSGCQDYNERHVAHKISQRYSSWWLWFWSWF